MEESEKKGITRKRKPRRTKYTLEKDFMDAVKSVIEKDGFSKTTLASIVDRADIMPNVFYNRYNSLDELFDEYVKRYDYWLADVTVNYDLKQIADYRETFAEVLKGLADSLYTNKSMQQLLIWELAEENDITSRSAKLREANGSELIDILHNAYSAINKEVDIRVVTALLIGGIYYLILHRNRSTFCKIDFSKKEGKELLKNTIHSLTRLIFDSSAADETVRIARNMKREAMAASLISKMTGLTESDIESL